MGKRRPRASVSEPSGIYVIHASVASHPLSYGYEEFPDALSYLEWILDCLKVMLGESANKQEPKYDRDQELMDERDAVKLQMETIQRAGTDRGITLCTPSWGTGSCDFSGYVVIADKWKEFVPEAIQIVSEALRSELDYNADEYEDADEDDCASLSDLEDCIASFQLLSTRKDKSSGRFAQDFNALLEKSIERYLEHL